MTVTFERSGGMPPGDRERLAVDDDGAFRLVRVYARRRAGVFGGQLSSDEAAGLAREASACSAEGAPVVAAPVADGGPPPAIAPDSAHERIDVGGVAVSGGAHDELPGSWGLLAVRLRRLLDELVDQPRAAVELLVDPGRPSARLAHAGREPLVLALGSVDVSAYLVGPEGETLGRWNAVRNGPGEVEAGPGWELDLGVEEAGFDLGPDASYQVTAVFGMVVDGVTHRARLWASSDPSEGAT